MQYLEIQSLDLSAVPLPFPGTINCFLDKNDAQYKGINSNGHVFLLHDVTPTNNLQQITSAGAITTNKITLTNLQINNIVEYINNTQAITHLNIGDIYRLPHQITGNYSALAVVGPKI